MSFKYPILHWLFTVFLGSIFFVFWQGFTFSFSSDDIYILPAIILTGLILAIPSVTVYATFYVALVSRIKNQLHLRIFVICSGIACIVISFFLISDLVGDIPWQLVRSYSIGLIISNLLFPVKADVES